MPFARGLLSLGCVAELFVQTSPYLVIL